MVSIASLNYVCIDTGKADRRSVPPCKLCDVSSMSHALVATMCVCCAATHVSRRCSTVSGYPKPSRGTRGHLLLFMQVWGLDRHELELNLPECEVFIIWK
jgi:hypothetical protein